jgi:hypothetical protein
MKTLLIISAILFSLPASAQMQMLFGRNVGAGITSPLDVDSIFYWFDAGQGVFDSVGNTISNFQGVGEWKDLSGNGHHTTQTTNGARPQYQATGGPNSRPALSFDGTNDILYSSNHFWGSDDLTVFVVGSYSTRNEIEVIASKGSTTGNNLQWFVAGGTTGAMSINTGRQLRAYNLGTLAQRAWNDGNKSVTSEITTFLSTSVGVANIYANGAAQNVTQHNFSGGDGTIFDSSAAPLTIGGGDFAAGGANFIQAIISEIIVYSRALTTAERQAIENYLNKKYNLY